MKAIKIFFRVLMCLFTFVFKVIFVVISSLIFALDESGKKVLLWGGICVVCISTLEGVFLVAQRADTTNILLLIVSIIAGLGLWALAAIGYGAFIIFIAMINPFIDSATGYFVKAFETNFNILCNKIMEL